MKASNSGGTLGEYLYDGDGKRVKKYVPSSGEVTIFVYDAAGKPIAEYSTIVYTGTDAKVAYVTNDHLGSPRINTDRDGNVTSRHDYLPFGEEITAAITSQRSTGLYPDDTIRKQFTGYERDTETDLDFAQARMYANRLGRFVSVDSVAPDLYTPQTLNRYEYCLNNPLRFVDARGEYEEDVHRDLTAALAYVVGFSAQQGNAIGNANQDVDISHNPEGVFSIKAYNDRVLFHFTTAQRRNELWGSYESAVARGDGGYGAALGTFLHTQQDSFSHSEFGPVTGQGWAIGDNFSLLTSNWNTQNKEMRKYDVTSNDPAKAVEMARDTLAKLLAARNLAEKSGKFGAFRKPVPWENDAFINRKLWEWAKTSDPNKGRERELKRNILFEIMNYGTHYWDPPPKPKKTKTKVRVLDE